MPSLGVSRHKVEADLLAAPGWQFTLPLWSAAFPRHEGWPQQDRYVL